MWLLSTCWLDEVPKVDLGAIWESGGPDAYREGCQQINSAYDQGTVHKPCLVCLHGHRYLNTILEIFTLSLIDHLWKWLKAACVYTLGGEISKTSEITRQMTLLKVMTCNRSQNLLKVERVISEEGQWVGQGRGGKGVLMLLLQHGDEGSSVKLKEKKTFQCALKV